PQPHSWCYRMSEVGIEKVLTEVNSLRQRLAMLKEELVRANQSLTDRKSTRLNSSHVSISYAVFCLKKKNNAKERHIADSTFTSLRPALPFSTNSRSSLA